MVEKFSSHRELDAQSLSGLGHAVSNAACRRSPFTPEGKTYRFEGEAAIGRMLAGMVGVAPFVASPTGFEPVF
jgi:hypothetical protein